MNTNTQKRLGIILSILGVTLALISLFIFNEENNKLLTGLCNGIGALSIIVGSNLLLKSNKTTSNSKVLKEQQILMKDERLIQIREKTSHMVSRFMDCVLLSLLWITGVFMGIMKKSMLYSGI